MKTELTTEEKEILQGIYLYDLKIVNRKIENYKDDNVRESLYELLRQKTLLLKNMKNNF
jgi:hypothetical protein